MRVVFRMSAIVAALAVATSAALTACGQRGPLYLPSVPPLPEKPVLHTGPSAQDSDSGSQAASDAQAHVPLTLEPADALGTAPNAQHPTPDAGAASSPAPDQ
jgi:predicted small lipoprotein YifL